MTKTKFSKWDRDGEVPISGLLYRARHYRAYTVILAAISFVILKYLLKYYTQTPSVSLPPTARIDLAFIVRDTVASPAAKALPSKGNLFCFVTTTSKYHTTRSRAVAETWLSRCDHGELFTNNLSLPDSVPYRNLYRTLNDSYEQLFWKTKLSLYYVYQHISSDFDWYLKADDDTYVIVENLRSFLAGYDPRKAHYFGFRMKPYLPKGYNSGGAGYVLSNEAMRVFAEVLYYDKTLCGFNEFEDVGIGTCLANAGIQPRITVDAQGRQRFLPYDFGQVFGGMLPEKEADYWFVEKPKKGFSAFSPELISIHHIEADHMRALEIALYRIRLGNRRKLRKSF